MAQVAPDSKLVSDQLGGNVLAVRSTNQEGTLLGRRGWRGACRLIRPDVQGQGHVEKGIERG